MIVKRKELQNVASRNVKKSALYPTKAQPSNPTFSFKNRFLSDEYFF